ncbi:MAG: FKBP-type peptidyl-prolyl cis-trans isomerase [Ardenticatenales bacterium]|nr:FKBP-type peptidyl-prolyl cis-trans isomerase [Ardenticatenales bacterium]
MKSTHRLAGLLLAATLIVACGTPTSQSNTGDTSPGEVAAPTVTAEPAPEGEEPVPETGTLETEDVIVGEGAEAKEGDLVSVHYSGFLEDGTKFDSSLDAGQPIQFVLGSGQVIPGWEQGLQGMKVGGKRTLMIPPSLAYGEFGFGNVIPPNATLRFEVELMDVKEIATEPASVQEYATTESGLEYAILQEGSGDAAKQGDLVTVHYTGWLEDGTQFDSSVQRGQPFQFQIGTGQVIKGWDEGIAGMTVGEQRQLRIPSDLAYGDIQNGPIPPKSTLIFDVELLAIEAQP